MSRAARFSVAAVACALLAGWLAFDYTGRAVQSTGPLTGVLIASAPLERGVEIDAGAALAVRRIPARFAPPDAIAEPADVIGERPAVEIPAGAPITRTVLAGGARADGGFKLRAAERAVSVDVVVSPVEEPLSAGDRVDLYASGFGGEQSTDALISGAEVLDVADGPSPGRQRPTLRLALEQVSAVVRADVFAHELRAVLRPDT